MKVKVTQEFQWAPDGNHVRDVKVGEVLEGRGAQVALELKKGVELGVQATAELSAATERASRAVLGLPEVLRLPPLEEYEAAGYVKESYPEFIVSQAVKAGKEGGSVAIRALTEAEAGERDQALAVARDELREVAPPAVEHSPAPPATASPVSMPIPDKVAQEPADKAAAAHGGGKSQKSKK